MSTWNLGAHDVSEETRTFKDKLASKEGQIAAQQDKIALQAAELEELNQRLIDAQHKATAESRRALQLESDLNQCSDDLRNERISSENIKAALNATLERNKGSSLEVRDLEATLQRLSYASDEHKLRGDKLEKEKSILEARVRELDGELRAAQNNTPTTAPGRRAISRPRSSSMSNFRIGTLEQDLADARTQLSKKDSELQALAQKFSHTQRDLIKLENESVASQRKWVAQLEEMRASLEEKDEELMFLREQCGDGSREDELLKRIEEDDARIEALEALLRAAEDPRRVKEKIRRLETQLQEEQWRRSEQNAKYVEAIQQKEDALDDLSEARRELDCLTRQLEDRDARERELNTRATDVLKQCNDPLMNDDSCLIDMDTVHLQPTISHSPAPVDRPDPNTVTHIETLLLAINRLRGERDDLRRDIQFLESESRFTIEALEAKLSTSVSTATVSDPTMPNPATIVQMKQEMDDLYAELSRTREESTSALSNKDQEIRRLGKRILVLSLVVDRLPTLRRETTIPSNAAPSTSQQSQDGKSGIQEQYEVAVLCLEAITSQRDDLLSQLQEKDDLLEREIHAAKFQSQQHIEELLTQVSELNDHIDYMESERDSLALQITNLTVEVQATKDDLANAETRYADLQFHQLSSMSSNEANSKLRDYIAELEGRVMRRTEQIGLHQHDIKRLETNIRLQEERLSELTGELEVANAQKDAMVEDCADAREARDEALRRIENLEEELEASRENDGLVTTMITVVADTTLNARDAIRRANEEKKIVRNDLFRSQNQVSSTLREVEDKTHSLATLALVSGQYRDELEKATLALAEREESIREASLQIEALEREKANLEVQLSILKQQDQDGTIHDLEHQKEVLEGRLQELESGRMSDADGQQVLVELKLKHAENIAALQGRLLETEAALEELQTRTSSANEDHEIALNNAAVSIRELEDRLAVATKSLEETQRAQDAAEKQSEESLLKLDALQNELDAISRRYDEVLQARDILQAETTRLNEQLESVQADNALLQEQIRSESAASREESDKQIRVLQGRLEENARLLDISKEEAARLSRLLLERTGDHDQLQQELETSSAMAQEHAQRLEASLAEAQRELGDIQGALSEAEGRLQAVDDEKTLLQQENTSLEAEIQKVKSLCRHLEAKIKESDHSTSVLRQEVTVAKEDVARVEKERQSAQMSLSLQNAQHKRETAEMERELTYLRSRPNLQQALSSLEERNNEMEELLRAKCTEIEENDDRVLELMKEKKKLSTKVESLTRKVQNLQTKLAVAKASPPDSVSAAGPLPSSSAHTTPSPPPVPIQNPQPKPATTSARARSVTLLATSSSMGAMPVAQTPPESRPLSRVVSGPSSIPRPKTPERKAAAAAAAPPLPVFRARTPERHILPMDNAPSSVIGKKRAAPEDFATCENVPVQAFTADGQDVENRTPRVKRMLSNLQSGFTPVRNQNRPVAPMPSPRRTMPAHQGLSVTAAPYISDISNTPLNLPQLPASSAKNKRSWLGKIRGSSQAADKPYMRSLFDRDQ